MHLHFSNLTRRSLCAKVLIIFFISKCFYALLIFISSFLFFFSSHFNLLSMNRFLFQSILFGNIIWEETKKEKENDSTGINCHDDCSCFPIIESTGNLTSFLFFFMLQYLHACVLFFPRFPLENRRWHAIDSSDSSLLHSIYLKINIYVFFYCLFIWRNFRDLRIRLLDNDLTHRHHFE